MGRCLVAQAAYNNATQAYVATGTTLALLGTQTLNCGSCDAGITGNGFTIRRSGVYRITFDVTSTPSAAGTQVLQLYQGGTALPCAITTDTTTDAATITQHVETTIPVSACCAITPTITAQISGVAGNVTHVCASLIRV